MANLNEDEDQLDPDQIYIEIPTYSNSPYHEKVPSGYDPMGEIYLRGRAYRGLAGGRIPWWVLISGWVVFGGLALLVLISAIASASFEMLPALIIVCIPLLILLRGTLAKRSLKKQRHRRR
jgi:hypothetical protein